MSFTTDSTYEKQSCNEFEDMNCVTDSSSDDFDEEDDCSSRENRSYTFSGESSSCTKGSRIGVQYSYKAHDVHDVKPDVADELKPNGFMRFKTSDDAYNMYNSYAQKAGFNVRKYSLRKDGDTVIHHYLGCHRMGKPPEKSVDMNNTRKTPYRVTDCKAMIVIKIERGLNVYKFESFKELHNHEMDDKSNLKSSRKLSYSDKEFIVRASTIKIGPSKAFKLRSTLKGGYDNVGAKAVDFKNFKRDMSSVIRLKDAQVLVNKLFDRKENYPNFSFYHRCDENKVLNALFWVDETEKAYYSEFGDVLSFDATFRSNKYDLVFVPFTVIDHHKSIVTVGSGLLSTEDVGSYKWLLEHFLKAHDNKHPVLVLTDQDASMKQAVESVFSDSKHRLCMWHIMKKLPKKIGVEFYKSSNFVKAFKKIVWDMTIEPNVFEHKWKMLMEEYVFKGKTEGWFKGILEIRDSWIPAYFNDYPMCGLMKTTSRSESMNSFFNSYSQADDFLINFMKNYDNAIQRIRYIQRELDQKSKIAQYLMKTPREIEVHAALVYTSKIFLEVQKEMFKGSWYCDVSDFNEGDGWEIYTIVHKNKKHQFKSRHKVEFKVCGEEIKCSCGHFNRFGILCRHAFKILLNKDVKEIPKQYILRRWRRDVIYSNYQLSRDMFDERDADVTKLVNEAFNNFESCLDMVRNNKEKLSSFVQKTESMLKDMKSSSSSEESVTKSDLFEKLFGVSVPDDVEIQVPKVQSNKGRSKKRFVGVAERSIGKSKIKRRLCSGCGKRDPHNVRTCPVAIAAAAAKNKK